MEGKKIIIFYYSYSSMSTEKLVKGIQEAFSNIEILLLPNEEKNDVTSYDYVGFASGIYAWDFGKPVFEKIEKLTGLEGKNVLVYAQVVQLLKNILFILKKQLKKKVENL